MGITSPAAVTESTKTLPDTVSFMNTKFSHGKSDLKRDGQIILNQKYLHIKYTYLDSSSVGAVRFSAVLTAITLYGSPDDSVQALARRNWNNIYLPLFVPLRCTLVGLQIPYDSVCERRRIRRGWTLLPFLF